jgi:hypothetical protein
MRGLTQCNITSIPPFVAFIRRCAQSTGRICKNLKPSGHFMYSRISFTKSPTFLSQTLTWVSQTLRSSYPSHMTEATTSADEYWLLHRSHCRITQTYAHKNSRTLRSGNISLGSVTLLAPEPGDIVELLQLSSGFNIQTFYVLTTEGIYTFCTVLRTNSYYFPKQ